MHFLRNLLRYMLPMQVAIGQSHQAPSGFDFVVTKRGTFVVTSRSKNVIAKAYV